MAEWVSVWHLLDFGSDQHGFDPHTGQICYGSFFRLPAVASVQGTVKISWDLSKRAGGIPESQVRILPGPQHIYSISIFLCTQPYYVTLGYNHLA